MYFYLLFTFRFNRFFIIFPAFSFLFLMYTVIFTNIFGCNFEIETFILLFFVFLLCFLQKSCILKLNRKK